MYGKRASKDVLFGIAGYGADKLLLAFLLSGVFLFVFIFIISTFLTRYFRKREVQY